MTNDTSAYPEQLSVLTLGLKPWARQKCIQCITRWAYDKQSRYVCVANVHMSMEAFDHPEFGRVVNSADLVVPDGRPLIWTLWASGQGSHEQIRGADLFIDLCRAMEKQGIAIGFYGGKAETLARMKQILAGKFPQLKVGCAISPPFRPLSEREEDQFRREIQQSGIGLLFVCLGCPKQEHWMARHKGRLACTMVGIGAALDFISGEKPEAPKWARVSGLEWAFRLACEPKRLWRRYLTTNPRFMWLAGKQVLQARKKTPMGKRK